MKALVDNIIYKDFNPLQKDQRLDIKKIKILSNTLP